MLSGLEQNKMTQLAQKIQTVDKRLTQTELENSYIQETLPPMFENTGSDEK